MLLALLAAYLLIGVNQERKHSNRLLAFIMTIFGFQNLIFILLFTKWILSVPWLLRTLAPTTFLIAPASFIYIRSVLNDELKFGKLDWLFLVPSVLVLVNFIPYYLLPIRDKIDYLNSNFYGVSPSNDPARGIVPGMFYYIVRICWSAIFLVASFRLIRRFKERNPPLVILNNRVLLNWLFTFNSLLTGVWAATVLKIFIPALKNTQFPVADLLLGITILFICLQLFMRPSILYGVFRPLNTIAVQALVLPQHEHETIAEQISNPDDRVIQPATENLDQISGHEQLRYKYLIEHHFQTQRPFLNADYSLEDLVADIRVPRYILSAFINQEYGMGFREFLNRHRVDFFKSNLQKPSWANLTLEAMAEECGFNSRSTFINNFKKITGQTPSDFIRHQVGK